MACQNTSPSVIIIPVHDIAGQDIVKGILDTEDLVTPDYSTEDVARWYWNIENKYYTSEVNIDVIKNIHACSHSLEEGEALIIYCDTDKEYVLSDVDNALSLLGDFQPEVQLLVCQSCPEERRDGFGCTKQTVQKWCIAKGWELIELYPEHSSDESTDSDFEDSFPESWGFKRIRQALHAHTWSNLVLKDQKSHPMMGLLQMASNCPTKEEDTGCKKLAKMTLESPSVTLLPVEPTKEDDINKLEEFEQLFSNLETMKRIAESLPQDQRKDFAERATIAFWKAIGGDESDVRDDDAE